MSQSLATFAHVNEQQLAELINVAQRHNTSRIPLFNFCSPSNLDWIADTVEIAVKACVIEGCKPKEVIRAFAYTVQVEVADLYSVESLLPLLRTRIMMLNQLMPIVFDQLEPFALFAGSGNIGYEQQKRQAKRYYDIMIME